MKRKMIAIQVFIDYWMKHGKVISKQEFDEIWQGDTRYYYKVKQQFLADKEFYVGKEERD